MTDLWFLTTQVLYYYDVHKYGPFHRWMCQEVGKEDVYYQGNKKDGRFFGNNQYWRPKPGDRQLWLLPRDHFKTTILTIAHIIQQILRNPYASMLMLSGKDEHALLFSDEIRRQFVFNERLCALFPPWQAPTMDSMGSKSEWTSPAKGFFGGKRREPTLVATGFKSRLESRHYDGGYLDDCMGEDDTSEVGLQEVRENYKKVIPLIDSDGWVIMPGTRKHYNDLYQGVMDTETYRVYVRHGLEHPDKMCDTDECSRFALPHKAPDFKAGVPLEPRRMDKEAFARKLAECQIDPKQGQSYFWHEYMNIPFSPTDRKYQPAWFVKVDDEMIPGRHVPFYPLNKWIAVDTALKDEEHPSGYDFNVVVVGGFDDQGRLFVLDIFRDRNWTEKHLADCIITCMKTLEYGGISKVVTEKVGEVRFNNYLRDRARQAGVPLQIISIIRGGRGAKSKFERIVGCQGHFEQGRVFFRRSCENVDDAINEFCNLGRWTNDDVADAISMFFDDQVKVLAPSALNAQPMTPTYRPMPFDGGWRKAAFSQMTRKPMGAMDFGRNGQVMVDGEGKTMFTPEQVELFAKRPDKQPQEPSRSFRPMR